MKLLFSYTLDYIRRNRRSSISIMVAILMTSMMLSALCSFLFNVYSDNLSYTLRSSGNWHGELFDYTPASKLPVIEEFDSIESIMIKGDWKVGYVGDPRRDYLVWRDANSEYWSSMPEGELAILEGRPPNSPDEIALSKQYFEKHPELKLGDTLKFPIGERIKPDGSIIAPQNVIQAGEKFIETGSISLKVVAKLDFTTSSTVPAYTALGFLDPKAIKPDDDITVYLRFKNIHDTYKELPKIAAAVGYEQDEYGQYLLRYNVSYLTRRAVLSPEQVGLLPKILASQAILTYIIMGLLAVGLFVLIIHNAFALSSSARLSQLGIFSSVGATPKQIKRSVVLEALLLTIIPLPFGIILGEIAVGLFINFSNQLGRTADRELMQFVWGWQSILPAILLTILTVWWSSLIPARKIAHLNPIAAIRQGDSVKLKKLRVSPLAKLFGLNGELASNALKARKRSYRTATISLTLSFLTLTCFLCISSASTASRAVFKTDELYWMDQDIMLTLSNIPTQEDFAIIEEKISGMENISGASWYTTIRTATWLSDEEFSDEFKEKGGFDAVSKHISKAQIPLLRDNKRRVGLTILGLDDKTFSEYCSNLGVDPAQFYESGHWRSILYHTVNDVVSGTKRVPVPIPFFDISSGDVMKLTETTIDSYDGDFTFDTEIVAIADEKPKIGSATFNVRYSALQFMPMSQVKELAANFAKSNVVRVDGVLQVSEPELITPTRNQIDEICENYYGSGDYDLFDEEENRANREHGNLTSAILFGFVAVLLAIIGLSNAWATVRGTLNARRREFAMLRSVGLGPRGLSQMLVIEAFILGITPILSSLPIVLAVQIIFLVINEITFWEWLAFAPWEIVLLYIVLVLAVTIAAYITGCKRLKHENIIEAIKLDSI